MLASEAELRARAQIIAAKCWRLNPKSRQNGARKNDEELHEAPKGDELEI